MKLYLVRHGEALPAQFDPRRPLSAQGQARVQQLAQRLAQNNVKVKHIFHSGIVRAEQTAAIIAQNLGLAVTEQVAGLEPEDPVEPLVQELAAINQDIMLVGHLPYMANLLWMLCKDGWAIQFDTATAVCLERTIPEGPWVVDAIFKPEDTPLT